MAQASHTVTIAQPVADVFAYVAEGGRCPEWRFIGDRHWAGVGRGARRSL